MSRIEFSVDPAEGSTKIIESIPMQDIIFEKFSVFEIEPARGETADSAFYDITSDTFPASSWQPVTMLQQVIRFTPASENTISKTENFSKIMSAMRRKRGHREASWFLCSSTMSRFRSGSVDSKR